MPEIIAVLSGKGGVGKTNVAVALAKVLGAGLLDVDLMGPNVPETLRGDEPEQEFMGARDRTIPAKHDGLEVMSLSYQLHGHAAFMQDSKFEQEIVYGWLNSIEWESEIVVVDTPPGTTESTRTILEKLPNPYAVIVTTGQENSIEDCKRSKEMIRHLNEEEDIDANITLLGIIENFAWYEPPSWLRDLIERADEADLPDDVTLPLLGHNNIAHDFEEPILSRVPYCKDWGERQSYIGEAVDTILEQDIPDELREALEISRMKGVGEITAEDLAHFDTSAPEDDLEVEVEGCDEEEVEIESTDSVEYTVDSDTDEEGEGAEEIDSEELEEIKGIGPEYAKRIRDTFVTWDKLESELPSNISGMIDMPLKMGKRVKEYAEERGGDEG